MTHRRALVCLLIAGLSVAPTTPRAQTRTPLSMPGYPAVDAPATVTILTPGAAPRTPLRYRVAAGHKSIVNLTMGLGMDMKVDGMAVPIDLPKTVVSATVDVTNVATNGDITFDLALTKVSPAPSAESGPAALRGTATVSSRGVTTSKPEFSNAGPGMLQTLGPITASVESLSMPFPDEAVGVGARWEVRQAARGVGITMFQTTEYHLIAMDASSVTVGVKVEQEAPPQPFISLALPPGADATVGRMLGSGMGKMTIRLDSLVPSSTMRTLSSMEMGMTVGGQVTSMRSETTMTMSIAPGVPN